MAKRKPQREAPPAAADDDAGSDTVRVASDLKRMVKWICRIEDIKASVLMEEIARDRLTARFEPYREYADQEDAREKERQARLEELRKVRKK